MRRHLATRIDRQTQTITKPKVMAMAMIEAMIEEAHISSDNVVDGQLALAVQHRRASVVREVAH